MDDMNRRIGVLECGDVLPELARVHGRYPDMFADLLRPVAPWADVFGVPVIAGTLPTSPDVADGWIVSGSRHGVYDPLPWIEPLKAFLRDCVAARIPVVGVCFGHQILAEALGGLAEKAEAGWELGVREYVTHAKAPWMQGVETGFSGHAIHQDQVTALPDDATILATAPGCPIGAVAYGDVAAPHAISVQPHPEFSEAFTRELLAARRGVTMPVDKVDAATETLSRIVDNDPWAKTIAAYFRAAIRPS